MGSVALDARSVDEIFAESDRFRCGGAQPVPRAAVPHPNHHERDPDRCREEASGSTGARRTEMVATRRAWVSRSRLTLATTDDTFNVHGDGRPA
jgi:hypothetical protein